MAAIAERLLQDINAKEDLSLRLGDALDVKASIGLALILFIATQTAYFLDKGISHLGITMQLFSIVSIVLAASFALAELWPRTYFLPDPESQYVANRIEQLKAHYAPYADADSYVTSALMEDEILWAKVRIEDDRKKNDKKSSLLNWSFCFTGVAIVLNLLTMLTLLRV